MKEEQYQYKLGLTSTCDKVKINIYIKRGGC